MPANLFGLFLALGGLGVALCLTLGGDHGRVAAAIASACFAVAAILAILSLN